MPQSEEDFIKKSKYITDRILVRDFFQWDSFLLHTLRSIYYQKDANKSEEDILTYGG